eukprot:TRINITY_DN23972_c0_g1_i1.p1 TRINITY_DN23972_c0_g1~~TRINITY_DN23972_c0_g1_i1.p1  ORF type:complete len:387 (+),score=56.77 TRINITY_DN23972_c0_g1_i1:39-1199(+)
MTTSQNVHHPHSTGLASLPAARLPAKQEGRYGGLFQQRQIHWADYVMKINRHWREDQRLLICTTNELFLCKANEKLVTRRVAIADIAALCDAPTAPTIAGGTLADTLLVPLVLAGAEGHDLLFRPRNLAARESFLSVLNAARRALVGRPVPMRRLEGGQQLWDVMRLKKQRSWMRPTLSDLGRRLELSQEAALDGPSPSDMLSDTDPASTTRHARDPPSVDAADFLPPDLPAEPWPFVPPPDPVEHDSVFDDPQDVREQPQPQRFQHVPPESRSGWPPWTERVRRGWSGMNRGWPRPAAEPASEQVDVGGDDVRAGGTEAAAQPAAAPPQPTSPVLDTKPAAPVWLISDRPVKRVAPPMRCRPQALAAAAKSPTGASTEKWLVRWR